MIRMSIKGTLNGQDEFPLADGLSLSVTRVELDSQGYPLSPVVACSSQSRSLWESAIEGLGCDPTSEASTSASVDFKVVPWAGQFLVFAGEQQIAVIDKASGQKIDASELIFTGKEALDVLQVKTTPNEAVLIVASTKKLIAVGANGKILWANDPSGLVVELDDVQGSELRFKIRDLEDVDLSLVDVRIDVQSGNHLG